MIDKLGRGYNLKNYYLSLAASFPLNSYNLIDIMKKDNKHPMKLPTHTRNCDCRQTPPLLYIFK